MRKSGKHVKGKSKFKKTVNGKKVDTAYTHGDYRIKFSRIDDSNFWLVTIKHPVKGSVSWESIQAPSTEAARLIGDLAESAFRTVAEENVYVMERIIKLNKKFPRATVERIFEAKGGWTDSRKMRILRRLRDDGAVKRKGKSKYQLSDGGLFHLRDYLVIANEGKRLFVQEEEQAKAEKQTKTKKKGKKK